MKKLLVFLLSIALASIINAAATSAGTDKTVDEGTTVTLDGSASSDPDGKILNSS